LKTSRLVIAIAFIGILMIAGRVLIDSDTWWHLRTGQWIVENRQLPGVDPFSFTRAGSPWHYPGWLAECLMFGAFSLAGLAGVNVLFVVIAVAACILIYLTMEGDSFIRAFLLVLAGASAAIFWSARPQMFTFLFGAIYFLLLRDFLSGRRNLLLLLPPIMILWVNMHGGFAVGFLFLLLAAIGQAAAMFLLPEERNRQSLQRLGWLAVIGIACLLAALCNPYGIEMLAYPFRTVSIQALQIYIQEWQSPDFHLLQAQPFLWLFFLTILLVIVSPKRADPRDLIFLGVIGYMGFLAWRNTSLLSIIAPAIAATHADAILRRVLPQWDSNRAGSLAMRFLNVVLVCLLGVAALTTVFAGMNPQAVQQSVEARMPVKAVDALQLLPSNSRMLNAYNWGSYLLWRMPDRKV
jgi:hypothetical protein